MERDAADLSAELEGAAAILFMIANPLLEDDNRVTDETIGKAVYSVALFLERIGADVGELPIKIGNL